MYSRLAKRYGAPENPRWEEEPIVQEKPNLADKDKSSINGNASVRKQTNRPSFLQESQRIDQRLKDELEAKLAAIRARYNQECNNENVHDSRQSEETNLCTVQSPKDVE
jgi:macrodomain Ter protein organizer (MatP/YcbG family)